MIAVVVLLSAILDFAQETRADRAALQLQKATCLRATVLREGKAHEVPSTDVVPGDLVVLSAGDLVPADACLVEARDLFVNQAPLTGESLPVEKSTERRPARAATLTDLEHAVLAGTSIVSGTGRALVLRTGANTLLGQIGGSLQRAPLPSAFERGTRDFGRLILTLASLMVVFVLIVNAARGRPLLASFLFAIALAVGLAPELLPMVVSVTLSRGALQMSRRKVLVKRLTAIHDLGSMDVLCTDKTGTLTEARICLERHIDAAGATSDRVLALAYLNSRFQSGLRSPLDDAILEHTIDLEGWHKLDEIPFDFARRRVSVLLRRGDQDPPLMVLKGAVEEVVRLSTTFESADGRPRSIDEAARASLIRRFEDLGREGFRVLGIATKVQRPACTHMTQSDESELVFAGFAAFHDPPKQSARTVLRELAELGIAIKVLTGDNELVAEHVCRELDFPVTKAMTGAEVEKLSDQALEARVEETSLFSRMTPAQKDRVLLALARRQHVVGFLGDGINDAAALHTAHVGISVDGAVDVAKEAADLILLEHDLSVLRDGVWEGRRTLGNITKYILMGTSSNFGNMFSMAGAALFLPFLPMQPIQILVNNFLYDLSEIPVPTDEVDPAFLRRPRRWDLRFIRRFMLAIGPISSVFDFLTFYVLYRCLHASEALFQTGWFVESLTTQVLVIFVIRTRANPLRSRPSLPLAATALLVVAAGVALPFTPLGAALGFVPLPKVFLAALAPTVFLYLAVVELVKRRFNAHRA